MKLYICKHWVPYPLVSQIPYIGITANSVEQALEVSGLEPGTDYYNRLKAHLKKAEIFDLSVKYNNTVPHLFHFEDRF